MTQQGWQGQPGFGAPPAARPEQASPLAVTALVLGIVSWIVGGILTAIPGAILGKIEMGKIARGESPAAGRTLAQVGFWLSLVHIVVVFLGLVLVACILGGMFLVVGTGAVR